MKLLKIMLIILIVGLASIPLRAQNNAGEKENINILEEISLGGLKQWILIRGENADNPILLYLHGGPGFPQIPFAHINPPLLGKHFLVVNWDQRGAGKSFNANIPPETMNVEQFLSDTHELIQQLKARFSKKKIFLAGFSWGSILGLYTAYRYPDDLYAYIGVGQVVNMKEGEALSYQYTMEKAKEADDLDAIKQLEKIGLPETWEGSAGYQKLTAQRQLLSKYGGSFVKFGYADIFKTMAATPYYTAAEKNNIMNGMAFTQNLLWAKIRHINFVKDVPELKIPVYFFEGKHDYQVPTELVKKYMEILKAPHKEIIWFENSGHVPSLDEPDAYQDRMVNVVLKNCFKE